MKKLKCVLSLVMMVFLLAGCYKTDTEFKIRANGAVDVTATMIATKEMYEAAGGSGSADIVKQVEMLQEYYGDTETGKDIVVTQLDANGNVIVDGIQAPEDGTMVGTKMEIHFDSIGDAKNSALLNSYLVGTPLVQDEEGYGLKIEEKRTLFGSIYKVSGKYGLYGSTTYKNAYNAAAQNMKDKISDASAKLTFSLPMGFVKSNADSKNLLGNRLTWVADQNTPDKEVYFEITALNPLVVGLFIAVLALLVLVLLLVLRKNKPTDPDDYFVDEEGNLIPIFDAADDANVVFDTEEVEEIAEEVVEEPAEEMNDEEETE